MIGAIARLGAVDGAAVRTARERAGLLQSVLALRAQMTVGTLSRAENGVASRKTIERIAAVLRVPAHQLAPDLVPVPEPQPPPPVDPRPEFRIAATQEGAR